jgi:shikimate kinase
MKPDLVVLTGFMATGKSVVGRLLAAALSYDWVDTDALIEDRHGPIHEIFRNNGEEAFRQMERRLADDLKNRKDLVVSTGGRMMLDPEIAESLGAAARIFCLTAEPAELQRRVVDEDGPERPLLGSSPAARIAELLAERAEGYAAFEQVPTDGITVEEVVQEIVARLSG